MPKKSNEKSLKIKYIAPFKRRQLNGGILEKGVEKDVTLMESKLLLKQKIGGVKCWELVKEKKVVVDKEENIDKGE